jgi:outer membrane protein
MDAYFSVSPAQSAASGLSEYEASAGFKNVSLEIGADYKLTERWTATSKLGYSHLLGDAADSPITASESQFSGGVGLTYTFGRIR